ncbi:hypothetical protein CHU92_01795 [Flavobacterium cyanobacteriorum]|uniref:DUF1343 domain-containing protein n=1 Tax=Flavobacterium cyanobacteriorum TaxID=2022802 RepID=A0A255ZWR7_9FLAO|nr:DUF1343 domain-containing protein [Flavobacterium cyanobacteriorum]OYQ45938.1 hypothetical protein CHU92_01795 [Flavobacterium cyanobacteriorum]
MVSCSIFKNTVLFSLVMLVSCNSVKSQVASRKLKEEPTAKRQKAGVNHQANILTGADNIWDYRKLLANKKIGVVTNQTGIVISRVKTNFDSNPGQYDLREKRDTMHLIDFLLSKKFSVRKIYAPEHGFRGTADAGEHIKDGKDTTTGLPIISLYGNNKKPKPEQLAGIDVLVFDLQDVGVRFYTYISTLHYVMEACAENNIPLIVLDRPNPNGSIVDGPTLEKEHTSFVGMHPIPVLHGMTIGEYAQMINGEKWLKDGAQCRLTVIPCTDYKRDMPYSLPVKPSPNLPNDQAINLYASLCLFEGTNVSMGRGTSKQFQVYGSPYLPKTGFSFTPMPNEGAKEPPYNGVTCYGEDLTKASKVKRLELKWLMKAYSETRDKSKFFIPFFTKLTGNTKLQQQIEEGKSEAEIRKTWEPGLSAFRQMRKKYLIYSE